jgi:hypothetical protein
VTVAERVDSMRLAESFDRANQLSQMTAGHYNVFAYFVARASANRVAHILTCFPETRSPIRALRDDDRKSARLVAIVSYALRLRKADLFRAIELNQ